MLSFRFRTLLCAFGVLVLVASSCNKDEPVITPPTPHRLVGS